VQLLHVHGLDELFVTLFDELDKVGADDDDDDSEFGLYFGFGIVKCRVMPGPPLGGQAIVN
jgi:hypothetical protein